MAARDTLGHRYRQTNDVPGQPRGTTAPAEMEDHGNIPVHLSLRGDRLTLTRESLMNLPESILLCLFPNGIMLNTPPPLRPSSSSQESLEEEEEEEVYFVDVRSKLRPVGSDAPGVELRTDLRRRPLPQTV